MLFNAYEIGNIHLVKYLVEHGANINKASSYGETAICYACKGGYEEIVKYLVLTWGRYK